MHLMQMLFVAVGVYFGIRVRHPWLALLAVIISPIFGAVAMTIWFFTDLDRQARLDYPRPASKAAWLPDPTHKHHYRYYDGFKWTHYVSNGNVFQSDE